MAQTKPKYITQACKDLDELETYLNKIATKYEESDDPQIFRLDEPQQKGYDVVVRVWIKENDKDA